MRTNLDKFQLYLYCMEGIEVNMKNHYQSIEFHLPYLLLVMFLNVLHILTHRMLDTLSVLSTIFKTNFKTGYRNFIYGWGEVG